MITYLLYQSEREGEREKFFLIILSNIISMIIQSLTDDPIYVDVYDNQILLSAHSILITIK